MRLQESGEMYIESIYVLSKQKSCVRSVDVAEYLGYSKPSVSRAIGLLKDAGYVESDVDGFLKLTADGRLIAEKTYERHNVLSECFKRLGVSETVADSDACKIEHVISDETFKAVKEYFERTGITR